MLVRAVCGTVDIDHYRIPYLRRYPRVYIDLPVIMAYGGLEHHKSVKRTLRGLFH